MISYAGTKGTPLLDPFFIFHGGPGNLVTIHGLVSDNYEIKHGILLRESPRWAFHWLVLTDVGVEDIHQDSLQVKRLHR
jgi:hypothetical protein